MSDRWRYAELFALILSLAGCGPGIVFPPATPTDPPGPVPATVTPVEYPTVTVTPRAPTPTAARTPEPGAPVGGGCVVRAERDLAVYTRPSVHALVFGTMTEGTAVIAEGRTRDGWLGFEPAVAQAANVGVFRLRWVNGDEAVRLVGACDDLPVLDGPPDGVCFTMPMTETPVYEEPAERSDVIAHMGWGDYAAVIARAEGWAEVDLGVGSTEGPGRGWVREDTLNLNGPCDSLPVVEPQDDGDASWQRLSRLATSK